MVCLVFLEHKRAHRLQRRKRPLIRPHMPLEGGAQGAIDCFRQKRDEGGNDGEGDAS